MNRESRLISIEDWRMSNTLLDQIELFVWNFLCEYGEFISVRVLYKHIMRWLGWHRSSRWWTPTTFVSMQLMNRINYMGRFCIQSFTDKRYVIKIGLKEWE